MNVRMRETDSRYRKPEKEASTLKMKVSDDGRKEGRKGEYIQINKLRNAVIS
jgi:hypothetical protein